MKQNITKEQWDELKHKDRENFPAYYYKRTANPPNIGQMIEFLGDDWRRFIQARFFYHNKQYDDLDILNNELCDALWEAVKHKLSIN